ncbi:hypothetical protein K431DRAFT_345269 [Polychaeton citri CBS 116435]|uniref:Mitochondrial import inner membrane translocase subunit TIM54 n=1 Tax=Polychaeton citri CBS 116435 TaxID=1314669 RepID=A0A9P4UQF4_9PEZI|nr:hypothetical protein K431DRAFT_345269 [Polychaeton citri CBS 116435]
MSDKPSPPAAENAAGASSTAAPSNTATSTAPKAGDAAKKAASEGNPAFRAMGLPRLRLPSRNWLIFWGVVGSFAGAVIYDKQQTKRNRQKWCDLVSHISQQPLATTEMPRRVTIYLSAPPGDGLRAAREHFHDYVKPILVAAAMDWDVVEGRKEGDVRYKSAEKIRRKRRKGGEVGGLEEGEEVDNAVADLREKNGTKEEAGPAGDIVIGRHTWKEYIRGMHEGWLGPVIEPPRPVDIIGEGESGSQTNVDGSPSLDNVAVKTAAKTAVADMPSPSATALEGVLTPAEEAEAVEAVVSKEDDAQSAEKKAGEKKKEEEEKPKPRHPPPFIQPSEYSQAPLSPLVPEVIGPSLGIPFPHLLGIRNTPIRIYRFLTRRKLADQIGRDVATVVLAANRPYSTSSLVDDSSATNDGMQAAEQSSVLQHEESDWWKKTVYRERGEHEEAVFIEPLVLDDRLAQRMRKFELSDEDEKRANRIADGVEVVKKAGDSD